MVGKLGDRTKTGGARNAGRKMTTQVERVRLPVNEIAGTLKSNWRLPTPARCEATARASAPAGAAGGQAGEGVEAQQGMTATGKRCWQAALTSTFQEARMMVHPYREQLQ